MVVFSLEAKCIKFYKMGIDIYYMYLTILSFHSDVRYSTLH